MRWVETLNATVDAEMEALPPSLHARLLRLMEAVEAVGLENMRGEALGTARQGVARGLYVTATGRRVIVLHVFVKKSQKTPRNALNTARERMKQVK